MIPGLLEARTKGSVLKASLAGLIFKLWIPIEPLSCSSPMLVSMHSQSDKLRHFQMPSLVINLGLEYIASPKSTARQ